MTTRALSEGWTRPSELAGLAAGAAGYLSKDARGNEIADAVLAVARGETVLGRDIQAAVAQRIRQTAARSGPNPRRRPTTRPASPTASTAKSERYRCAWVEPRVTVTVGW